MVVLFQPIGAVVAEDSENSLLRNNGLTFLEADYIKLKHSYKIRSYIRNYMPDHLQIFG